MGEQRRRYFAHGGVEREIIFEDGRPDFTVKTSQDIEPVLDSIARDREIMTNRGHNKLAARLPMFIVENLIHRGIYDDPDAFRVWLNGPEATPWRIWKGAC